MAELTIPATWALPWLGPEPVSPVNPALAATRVRLATVAARYSWNRVLARPNSQWPTTNIIMVSSRSGSSEPIAPIFGFSVLPKKGGGLVEQRVGSLSPLSSCPDWVVDSPHCIG